MGLAAAAARPLRLEWTPLRLRALRHALWVGAALFALSAVAAVPVGQLGFDAHAYWSAWRHGLYSAAPGQRDAYLYSPAFAEGIWPLTLLPWPVFCAGWMLVATGIYAWLLAPLGRTWALPLLIMCTPEILSGNVWPFFALVAVFGFRYPAVWAFPLLLKVTPAVGIVWFAVRREWRRAAIALAAAAAVAGSSFALLPAYWFDWVRLLLHPSQFANSSRADLHALLDLSPKAMLLVGLPLGVGLTVYAARTNRPRLLPVAMLLASPVFGLNVFALLTAIPRLASSRDARSRRPPASPTPSRRRAATATTPPAPARARSGRPYSGGRAAARGRGGSAS